MSTLPISKQAIVTGTQAIQGFQKDGLLVPSSGVDELVMLTASNVPQTGFIYTIPTTMMSLMPRSFKTSEMSTAANYTLLVNDSPIASSTSTFVNLPVMALRGGDVITLTHDSSLTFDFQIFASPVYSVEIIKLN